MQVSKSVPAYLPREIIERIVTPLDPLDRSRAACVNRTWHAAATQEAVWAADAAALQPPRGGSFKAWSQQANQTRGPQRQTLQALVASLSSATTLLSSATTTINLTEPPTACQSPAPKDTRWFRLLSPRNDMASRIAARYCSEVALPPLDHLGAQAAQARAGELARRRALAFNNGDKATYDHCINERLHQRMLMRMVRSLALNLRSILMSEDMIAREQQIVRTISAFFQNGGIPGPAPLPPLSNDTWRGIEVLGRLGLFCIRAGMTATEQTELVRSTTRRYEMQLAQAIPQAVGAGNLWALVLVVLALRNTPHLPWSPGERQRLIALASARIPTDPQTLRRALRQGGELEQKILARQAPRTWCTSR